MKGIFFCGHADINAGYSFISLDAGDNNFGKETPLVYGLKLKNSRDDSLVIKQILSEFDGVEAIGWREYNRGFFGVLRMEKNILFLLILYSSYSTHILHILILLYYHSYIISPNQFSCQSLFLLSLYSLNCILKSELAEYKLLVESSINKLLP